MRRGSAEPAADLDRGQRVGRRDDRPERERRRPREPVDQRVRDDGDRAGGRDHEPDRQQRDRADVVAEVAQAREERRRVQQRRQEDHEHELRVELDLRDPRRRSPSPARRARARSGTGCRSRALAAAEQRRRRRAGRSGRARRRASGPPGSGSPRRSRARPPRRARAAGRRGPSTSLSVRYACVTATLPHSDCAISCAVSGRSASSPRILRARRSCIAKRSSISSAWSPNGVAVAGEHALDRPSRASRASTRCRSAARAGGRRPARRTRPPSGREISGLEEMCAIRWSPPNSVRGARASKNTVSDGRVARDGGATSSVRPANSSALAVGEPAGDRASSRPSRGTSATRRAARSPRRAGCRGAASAPRPARRRARRARRSPRSPAPAGRARTPRRPERRARMSTSPMWSRCWWVITIRSRSSIRRPCAASARSSSSSALPELGPVSTSVSGSSSIR